MRRLIEDLKVGMVAAVAISATCTALYEFSSHQLGALIPAAIAAACLPLMWGPTVRRNRGSRP